ncbi:hypothetical protein BX661DRAFT_176951 [Kickxella alabastrina]|uniref:uncharacterized protein n=1 Tax=Kickxella alabastrina TaxID=61397 RepID=UPI00221F2251|nr:uncharacterized protein BX661DRAFT_176951 [Kickxella alabastrina]KAI7834303.1 hypothetical protein BX661DRAFT_176951 [Kickxella alabastrina]
MPKNKKGNATKDAVIDGSGSNSQAVKQRQRRPHQNNDTSSKYLNTSKDKGNNESSSSSSSDEQTSAFKLDSAASTANKPQIPGNVIRNLVVFSLLLLIVPILVYFASLRYVFVGATAASAIVAVVAANLVLGVFVYVAWNEELDDVRAPADKRKGEKARSVAVKRKAKTN